MVGSGIKKKYGARNKALYFFLAQKSCYIIGGDVMTLGIVLIMAGITVLLVKKFGD